MTGIPSVELYLPKPPACLAPLELLPSFTACESPPVVLQLGFVIAMVTGIHFVEAYLLNPAIYSAHLKLHPLLVLTTLVVAEHSLGVWGLLLAGLPPVLCSASLGVTKVC